MLDLVCKHKANLFQMNTRPRQVRSLWHFIELQSGKYLPLWIAEMLDYHFSQSFSPLGLLQDSHGHMIKIQIVGNGHIFMMVSVSQGHGMPFCDLLKSKVNGKARTVLLI